MDLCEFADYLRWTSGEYKMTAEDTRIAYEKSVIVQSRSISRLHNAVVLKFTSLSLLGDVLRLGGQRPQFSTSRTPKSGRPQPGPRPSAPPTLPPAPTAPTSAPAPAPAPGPAPSQNSAALTVEGITASMLAQATHVISPAPLFRGVISYDDEGRMVITPPVRILRVLSLGSCTQHVFL